MADQHDEALDWAQAHPDDPRSQHIQAKAWASKNLNDPRSAQILSKLGGQEPDTSGVINKVRGFIGDEPIDWNKEKQISADIASGKTPSPAPIGDDLGSAAMAIPVESAPAGLAKLAGFLGKSGAAPAAARVGVNAAMGAGSGALSHPDDPVSGAKTGGAIGLLTGTAGEGLSALLGKAGDVGMQAAVGRRKYTPGVGTELADQGLIGTRGMLKKQTQQGLEDTGTKLNSMAKDINQPIDALSIGKQLNEDVGRPLRIPGAAPSPADEPKLQAIQDFTQDVMGRGQEDGPTALARRIAAGQRSYRGKEDPLQSVIGQLSKGEQQGYSQALKDAHADSTGTTDFADADRRFGALKRAQSALDEDPTLPKSLFGIVSQSASMIPGGAPALSTLGQALTKGGQAAGNPALRQVLIDKASK